MKIYPKLIVITLFQLISTTIFSHSLGNFYVSGQDIDSYCTSQNSNSESAWEKCMIETDLALIQYNNLDNLATFTISLTIDDSGQAVSSGDYIFCNIQMHGEFDYSSQHKLAKKKINQYLNHFLIGNGFFEGRYNLSSGLKSILKYANSGHSIEIDCPSSIELPTLLVNSQGAVYELTNKNYLLDESSDLNLGHNYSSHVKIYEKGAGPVISQPSPQPSSPPPSYNYQNEMNDEVVIY